MAEIGKDIAAFVKTVDEHRRKFSRFAAARNGWEPWGNITFARESADGKSVEVCAGYFLGLQAPSRPERSVKAFFRIDALGNIFPAEPLAVFPYAEKFCNIMESDNYFWWDSRVPVRKTVSLSASKQLFGKFDAPVPISDILAMKP